MVQEWRILATDSQGVDFLCFTWRGDSREGIMRARRDAIEFGCLGLGDFRAVSLSPRKPKFILHHKATGERIKRGDMVQTKIGPVKLYDY